jgi:hypothetical protein
MKKFNGKAIYQPLKEGSEWERFKVVITPEFEDMIEKAKKLLYPYAEKELKDVSYSITYFKIDGDDNSEYDVCDNDDCIKKLYTQLKEEYPDSVIEIAYSDNDSDHDNLECCAACGRHLNTQLTYIKDEVDYYLDDKEEWNKESFILNAFDLFCILEALPSNDYDASKWAINQYYQGNTFHIDLRTKFYEKIMELIDSIITHLTNSEIL